MRTQDAPSDLSLFNLDMHFSCMTKHSVSAPRPHLGTRFKWEETRPVLPFPGNIVCWNIIYVHYLSSSNRIVMKLGMIVSHICDIQITLNKGLGQNKLFVAVEVTREIEAYLFTDVSCIVVLF